MESHGGKPPASAAVLLRALEVNRKRLSSAWRTADHCGRCSLASPRRVAGKQSDCGSRGNQQEGCGKGRRAVMTRCQSGPERGFVNQVSHASPCAEGKFWGTQSTCRAAKTHQAAPLGGDSQNAEGTTINTPTSRNVAPANQFHRIMRSRAYCSGHARKQRDV